MKIIKWILKKIGLFLLFIIKTFFKTVIAIFVFIILLSTVIYFIVRQPDTEITSEMYKYKYIEIDMSKTFTENNVGYLGNLLDAEQNYFEFLKVLKKARDDKQVKGIIFKLEEYSLNAAQNEEVGKILASFPADKEIITFAPRFEKNSYFFASNSRTIVMPNTFSSVSNILGYYVEMPFYKRLADKVGIGFTVIHMGNYKSFGETYSSTMMSQYSKENLLQLLNSRNSEFLNRVSERRKINRNILEQDIDNGKLLEITPPELKDKKLIDELMYYHELIGKLGKNSVINLNIYKKILAGKESQNKSYKNYIGVIPLNGEILEGQSQGVKGIIEEENTVELLQNALEDNEIKGVVLRIDSPGGSAYTSNSIYSAIKTLSAKKPVYVSMGSVAASGGYFISAAANKIYANKATVTGSIGVVFIIPNYEKLANKIGVDVEILSKGKNADINSMLKPMSKEKYSLLSKSLERIYLEFKSKVAEGRKMSLDKIEDVAKGRVWLGEDARDRGLVDGIASFDEVVQTLASDLNLKEGSFGVVQIINYDASQEFRNYFKILKRYSKINSVLEFFKIGVTESLEEMKTEKAVLYSPVIEYIK
ncbi:MAG: signal peptide peptidase SppA [Fusobacteriaceae bacterium]